MDGIIMIDWKYKINLGIESLKNVIKNEELDIISKYGIIYACELLEKLVPKMIKNDKWFFNLIVDNEYINAIDFLQNNKNTFVRVSKKNKDKLKNVDLINESVLLDALTNIYDSDEDLINEALGLDYDSDNHFVLLDFNNNKKNGFHIRVWECTKVVI